MVSQPEIRIMGAFVPIPGFQCSYPRSSRTITPSRSTDLLQPIYIGSSPLRYHLLGHRSRSKLPTTLAMVDIQQPPNKLVVRIAVSRKQFEFWGMHRTLICKNTIVASTTQTTANEPATSAASAASQGASGISYSRPTDQSTITKASTIQQVSSYFWALELKRRALKKWCMDHYFQLNLVVSLIATVIIFYYARFSKYATERPKHPLQTIAEETNLRAVKCTHCGFVTFGTRFVDDKLVYREETPDSCILCGSSDEGCMKDIGLVSEVKQRMEQEQRPQPRPEKPM